MKTQLLFMLLSLFLFGSCEAQTQLPKQMPENVSFSLYQGGGKTRAYKKIRIEEGVLEMEELIGNQGEPQKRSANISEQDLADLYRVFVKNKFDQIKNDERKSIVYDAGSETISISIQKLKSFNVISGKNSPLSGENLRRYQAVKQAFEKLIEKSKNQKDDFQIMTTSEAEKFLQGKWRAAGGDNIRAWFLDWTFDNGKFKQVGYPPIQQEGKYKILRAEKEKITLELYEQKGTFGEETETLEIFIDPKTKLLTISQIKNFSRVIS